MVKYRDRERGMEEVRESGVRERKREFPVRKKSNQYNCLMLFYCSQLVTSICCADTHSTDIQTHSHAHSLAHRLSCMPSHSQGPLQQTSGSQTFHGSPSFDNEENTTVQRLRHSYSLLPILLKKQIAFSCFSIVSTFQQLNSLI